MDPLFSELIEMVMPTPVLNVQVGQGHLTVPETKSLPAQEMSVLETKLNQLEGTLDDKTRSFLQTQVDSSFGTFACQYVRKNSPYWQDYREDWKINTVKQTLTWETPQSTYDKWGF